MPLHKLKDKNALLLPRKWLSLKRRHENQDITVNIIHSGSLRASWYGKQTGQPRCPYGPAVGTSTAVNRTKQSPSNHVKAFAYIYIKVDGFPFTHYITFADDIRNTFIKRNKDHNIDPNTSTTYVLPYSKPSISYIAVITNPTDYVFINTRLTHKFRIPKRGHAPSKALPLFEASPPTNTNQQNTKT